MIQKMQVLPVSEKQKNISKRHMLKVLFETEDERWEF